MLATFPAFQDHATAAAIANRIGLMAGIFAVAVPMVLYLVIFRLSPPANAKAYAIRFGCWPLVFVSYVLGGPLARAVSGHTSRYLSDFPSTLMAVLMLGSLLFPIFWGIGRSRGKKKFPQQASPQA
jgi:fructose-specific phosphotransferase system IIC component